MWLVVSEAAVSALCLLASIALAVASPLPWRAGADVSVCRCGIDEETAARIAREIMGGDTSNPHLAEERGQEVDDSGVSCWPVRAAVPGSSSSRRPQQQQQVGGASNWHSLSVPASTQRPSSSCLVQAVSSSCYDSRRCLLPCRSRPAGLVVVKGATADISQHSSCLLLCRVLCCVLCCAMLCSWTRRTSTQV